MEISVISQFNKFARQDQNLIQKALTSATGVGAALIPQNLEEIITNTVIHLSPELAMITPVDTEGAKTHEFNRKIQNPAVGGAMGESATTPATNSKTLRAEVTLKIVRRKGQVTNFLNDASRKYLDVAAYEMQNHLEAHVKDLIHYSLYGNKDKKTWVGGTAEQIPDVEFHGLDRWIATNRINKARSGIVPTSLKELNDLIDASNRKGGARHRRAFGMSPEMLSKFSELLTNVRLNQGLTGAGLTQVDVNGGWRLNAYRDIPIIETTSTRPVEQMRPTVTLAAIDDSLGSLSNGTYYVQIAPLTLEGEQEASAEESVTLAAGTATQKIRIALSDIHKDVSGIVNCYGYKIYMSASTGTEVLKKIVPAYIYDAALSPSLTSFNGVGTNYLYITSTIADTSVPTAMQADVPLVATGGVRPEIVYLWDLDPIQGLGKMPYTNMAGDKYNGLVTTKPLAEIDDYIQFLVKTYAAIADSYEATSCWLRGLRTA